MNTSCVMLALIAICTIYCCNRQLLCLACPTECACSPASQNVVCNGVTHAFNSYVSSIPAWVSRIMLMCQPQLSNSGRPLPIGSALSGISPGVFKRFAELREVSIRSCPIATFPPELFGFLPQLESVTLDNLPLTSLPPALFHGSRQLRDFVLLRSPEFRSQPPALFIDNPGLRLLRLVEAGLNREAMANLLASAGRVTGITDVEVKMTADSPLSLSADAFANFSLARLGLSNNGIVNFDFLPGVGAAAVTLSYNPVPSGRLSLTSPVPNYRVTSLRLEHMGLYDIPDNLSATFPNLAELHIASNVIAELTPDRLENLTKLVKLDLSSNQIQTLSNWQRLQPLLSGILYRDRVAGQIYLADNPLHCNCELQWIYDIPVLSSSMLRDLACRTGQFAGELLFRVQRHQLRCARPTAPNILAVGGNSSGSDAISSGNAALSLAAGQNVTLTCSSSGDPAPSLAWRLLQMETGAATPEEVLRSKRNKDYTASRTDLVFVISHGQISAGRHAIQCVAASPYFAELSANASLVVMATGSTATTPGRDSGVTAKPNVNGGVARSQCSLGQAVLLSVALLVMAWTLML